MSLDLRHRAERARSSEAAARFSTRLTGRLGPLQRRSGYVLRASRNVLRHPLDLAARVQGRIDRRVDTKRLSELALPPEDIYRTTSDWPRLLHEGVGLSWPCEAGDEFTALWKDVADSLEATGKPVGHATYGGWNDGDIAFAHAVWCLVAHLRPARVVETGVARGVTSRVVLEGLERNANGRLWSIDLPAVDPALHEEIGAAVPARLAARWRYVAGTSRQRLRGVLAEATPLDIFIHDSLHTGRNVSFELEHAWRALRPGRVVVVDDVDHSLGFKRFLADAQPRSWFTAKHADGRGLWGVALK